jgi:4-hydroxy-tetrahydrodipicolinate synthase
MTRNWTGCGTALVTPFTTGGTVDEPAVRRLAARQIDAGVHFLVPCGTTGESPTLTPAEMRRVVELVVETAAGRVPVLAGAGGNDTRSVIALVADMQRVGADGILSVTPYYNRPTQEGLVQHYRAIAESTSLPIVVYNVPGRTGCNVEVDTLCRLAQIPNIVGVKEASANMPQMCAVCRAVPTGFSVLSGDDLLTVPLMSVGGSGVISVASNEVPAEMAQHPTLAADADQFHRGQPDTGQGRDGPPWASGTALPPPDGRANTRLARADRGGARRARDHPSSQTGRNELVANRQCPRSRRTRQ